MIFNFCVACGVSAGDNILLHSHHLVPKSMGGSDKETNLITLCHMCHGKLHGFNWRNNYKELHSIGIEKAKKMGKFKGRTKDKEKHKLIRDLLNTGYSWKETMGSVGCSRGLVAGIARELKAENAKK